MKKRDEWYESLPNETKEKIMSAYDEKSKKYYIKHIKRKRNPDIKEGDIFAILLPEGCYVFGRPKIPDKRLFL